MKKFLALYLAPVDTIDRMMAETTLEEREEGMAEWATWMKDNAEALADMGAPVGKTKEIDADGISDTRNEVLGYSIVKANSLEDAAKLFSGSPQTKMLGGSIQVMELMPM